MDRTMMSPADAVWYRGENPVNPMTISAILWFDRPLDVDRVRQLLEERLLERHPVFCERVVPSRVPGVLPHWQRDPDMDIDDHLTVVDLPAPGDHAALEAACSQERSTPLDRTRPLWSLTVYQGYRGTQSALHARLHHSIGDGLALMRLLLGLTDEEGTGELAWAEPVPHRHEIAELGRQALAATTRLVHEPHQVADVLRDAAGAVSWGGRLLAPTLAERSVLQGRPSGVKRMAWDPDGLDLATLKDAGHELGATVNDLLLTVLAGGLHTYLDEHHGLVDDVLMMVPVNLRRPGAPLPRRLGNRIGLLPILLPVGSPDPRRRLALVQERIQRLKDSPAPVISRALLLGTSLATPGLERGIHRLNQWFSTGVVTNVPGPSAPLHLAGARLLGTVGWGGMTGHLNLSAAFISLHGRVYPGLVTDEAITPDPDRLLAMIGDEWHRLLAPGGVLVG
jgi:diacylglycerol O-acyltransferase / wax synthase